MKILINISTDSELKSYEAISLGFVLASFDHDVQFVLSDDSLNILNDPTSRLHGMIQSLELYDLPVAWAMFDVAQVAPALSEYVHPMPTDEGCFDIRLNF